MTKQELEKRLESALKQIEGLKDEAEHLTAKLADVEDEPEIPDYLEFERGEKIWFVKDDFCEAFEYAEGCKSKEFNSFHTESYAQEFADKCKLIAMLLHCKWYLCPDYVPDFTDNNEEKHYVYYDVCSRKYTTDWRVATINNEVFFDTRVNAQKAADWLNKNSRNGG